MSLNINILVEMDRVREWRMRLGSALRTVLACSIVGCTTLYGPERLRAHLVFSSYSYVIAILIVSDATLGDTFRSCWHVLCATAQVVPPSMLVLWLVGPARFTSVVAAFAAVVGAFLVALPEGTHLMCKRIAFGQIVIVYVGAVIHGGNTRVIMHPANVATSTCLGALAAVLALLLPYPRLAYFEVRQLCGLYAENALERISVLVKAFSAQDNTSAWEAITQAKPLAKTGAKLLHSMKLIQEGVMWERPQIRPLKPNFTKPGDRLQDTEIPIRGMEMALTSSPSFPLHFIDQELSEVLPAVEKQIGLKLEQAKCFPPVNVKAPEPNQEELFNNFLESRRTISPNSENLTTFFFLSCIKQLLDDSSSTPNPNRPIQKSTNEEESKESTCGFLKRICSSWCKTPKKETLIFASKCSLSLGLAVFFGLLFNKQNGYWSGLMIAISFAAKRQATFTNANARAQGTAMGSVYGVLCCFLFREHVKVRVLALLPWIIFTSLMRHNRMYGQPGGISAAIGASLILGRKNYGAPVEFAIIRLTEAFIGLLCSLMVELLLQPTRATTLAKKRLSQSLGTLRECIGELGLPPNKKDVDLHFLTLREKQEKLKEQVNELEKFSREAELEPNFSFLPFQITCYNKLLVSISLMMDLLLFMVYRMEFLVEESQRCEIAWRELQEPINGDLESFKKWVGSSLDCLEKVTLIKFFAAAERGNQVFDHDLELGLPNADAYRMYVDEEEAEKIVSSFLRHSQEVTDNISAQEGEERSTSQMALCLSALGFCIRGLMSETKEIEKGIKELVLWENPSSRINFHEISGKIKALFPE